LGIIETTGSPLHIMRKHRGGKILGDIGEGKGNQ